MAFDYTKLSRIGGSGDSQKVYAYASTESIATVTGSDFFLQAINELNVNYVLVSDTDAAAVTITFVKTNNGTTIDCASGTALGDA